MRVLQLLKTSTGGFWALAQMRELVRAGVEVHVAMPTDGPLTPAYREAGIHVHAHQLDLPLRRPWRWPTLARELRALVDRVAPDVVHSHFVGTTLSMRLALGADHPVPRAFQVPGPLHLEHPFFRGAEIASAGPADFWMGACRWTADRYLRSGVREDRVFLAYYGLDLARFEERPRGRLRAELGLAGDTPVVGMVSYLYAPKRHLGQTRGLKGHEDLIDAFARLLPGRPDAVCVIVGGAFGGASEYERQVRRYAAERCGDRVVFLGHRTDVLDLYADFDVAVHPSHSENLGGAGESLLLAVPTVSTDVGGFPDIVRSGDTGWAVPARDPAALAEAVSEALADPAEARRRALRGREHMRGLVDITKTTRELIGFYRTMQERHPPR